MNPSLAAAHKSYIPDSPEAGSENRWSNKEEHRYLFAARSEAEEEACGLRIVQHSLALFHKSPYRFRDEACQGISGL